MVMITDGFGTRWVSDPPRKRRRKPKPVRFAGLQVGAVLIQRRKTVSERHLPPAEGFKPANENPLIEERHHVYFAVVEDRWFDPCAGQSEPILGEMAGVRPIGQHGRAPAKYGFTLLQLAKHGYHYATPEQAALIMDAARARETLVAAFDAGQITAAQARLKVKPWAQLIRECGL